MTSLRSLLVAGETKEQELSTAADAIVTKGFASDWGKDDVKRLVHVVKSKEFESWSPQGQLSIFSALKLVGRGNHYNEPMFELELTRTLAKHAFLVGSTDGASCESPESLEALKVLANMLLLRQDLVVKLIDDEILRGLCRESKRADLSLEAVFLLYRLLFLVTVTPKTVPSVIAEKLANYAEILASITSRSEGSPPFTRAAAVGEVLKTMFNLVMHGEGNDVPKAIMSNKTMQQLVRVIMEYPTKSDRPFNPPHSHSLHMFLHDHSDDKKWCTPEFVQKLCLDFLAPELARCVAVASIKDSQDTQLNSIDQLAGNDDSRVVPLFQVLTDLYEKGASEIRLELRKHLAPDDLDRSQPIESKATLPHSLIRLLTSVEYPSIRECTELLLYTLFDKDARKLVAYTGFGPAAGFLVNRGLLTPDVLQAQQGPGINPITGTREAECLQQEWEKMTDDEKEKEAEKLFVAFERLNKLGIIKAIDPKTGKEIGR